MRFRRPTCSGLLKSYSAISLRSLIAEQVGEGGLEGVVVFPVREVGDVVFANLFGEVFAGIGVIAAPVADAVAAPQSDRKQLLPLLDPFGRAGAFDFSPPPCAVNAVLLEHQQQVIVELGGPLASSRGA